MNGETNNNKMYAVLGILLIVVVGWYLYSRQKPSEIAGESFIIDDPMMLAAGGATGDVGMEILDLLSKIQGLRIDTTLFADPAYRSLSDYTQQVAPQPVGRDNPFAPIPGGVAPRSASDPRLDPNQPSTTR